MPSEANDFGLNCFGPYHIQIGGKEERHEISTEAPMRTVVDDDDEPVVADVEYRNREGTRIEIKIGILTNEKE